jgi:hypothetical protein
VQRIAFVPVQSARNSATLQYVGGVQIDNSTHLGTGTSTHQYILSPAIANPLRRKTSFQHSLANIASLPRATEEVDDRLVWCFSSMADIAEGESYQTPSGMGSDEHTQTLPALLALEPFDVVLGRGRTYLYHPGNMRMKALVLAARPSYNKAGITRTQKTRITQEIVQAIQTSGDQPGRFLMHDASAGCWT